MGKRNNKHVSFCCNISGEMTRVSKLFYLLMEIRSPNIFSLQDKFFYKRKDRKTLQELVLVFFKEKTWVSSERDEIRKSIWKTAGKQLLVLLIE